jgi:inner membrane protein
MDPIAHTFTGAALAAAGLRRATPLAGTALVIGANVPDVDVLAYFGGAFQALEFRRGWTHGVLAIALLPVVVTGLLLGWDRWVRRRTTRHAEAARAGPLLAVAAVGVVTHPALDWLNNYGLRWLMPFDGRWFYGDALFIIDPWVWLLLGGVLTLACSRRPLALAAWAAFWALASTLVLMTPEVPWPGRALWIAGVVSVLAARMAAGGAPRGVLGTEWAPRAALGVVVLYAAAAAVADIPARAEVRAALARQGVTPIEAVMIAPAPGNPFAGDVVAAGRDAYYLGRWYWLSAPRFMLDPEPISRSTHREAFEAAARSPDARRFLTWARFPYVEVDAQTAGGYTVRFLDARYRGTGRLGGPTVQLDRDLGLAPAP